MVLNKKAIKDLIKSKGFNVGSDYLDNLEAEVLELVSGSINRSSANARKTVYGRDI